jgi:hypothetical protein
MTEIIDTTATSHINGPVVDRIFGLDLDDNNSTAPEKKS